MKSNKPVIVYILPRDPWPPYAGQTRLSYFRAKELKKKGYNVILITFTNLNLKNSEAFTVLNNVFSEIHIIPIKKFNLCIIALNAITNRLINNIPLQASFLNSNNIIKKFIKKIDYLENKFTNTYYHFYSIRSFFLWSFINKYKKPFVIDLVDSMSLNLQRKCSIIKDFKKYFWQYELNSVILFEQNLPSFEYCKNYIVVSEMDKKYLKVNYQKNNDSIFVSSVGCELKISIKKKKKINPKNIIFFGSLTYEPNLTAIYWLLKNVMPYVWEKDQNIILNIAGRKPSNKLINLCKKNNQILLMPNPISMSKCIKDCSIAVLPLLSGSGQQNKIIEAMACGVPVITTEIGASPFSFKNNKDLIVANKPINFANALLDLINNIEKREILKENAYQNIKNNFEWAIVVNKLENNIYI